jgi:hypothetical protein
MPFPQVVSRLRFLMFSSALFLLSAVTPANSASRTVVSSPSSVSFGNVQVGSKQTKYETLTNSGTSALMISQANVSGTGFSLSGLSLPITLNKGESVTFNVVFTPKAGGSSNGGITVNSNASNSSLTIALSGTGVSGGKLTSSASTLNFGSVNVGSIKTLTANLSATGSSVTISSASTTNSEFTLAGMSLPKTIPAGQSISVTLTFAPRASGTASGSISLASNAANTPAVETLTGSGTGAARHSVALSWTASTSPVAGYNVYRSGSSGGPYTKLTSVLDASTKFVDSSVQSGLTYYYVNTAVDSHGAESKYSAQLRAAIPNP